MDDTREDPLGIDQKCDELRKLFNFCKIFHFTEACTVILYTRGQRGCTVHGTMIENKEMAIRFLEKLLRCQYLILCVCKLMEFRDWGLICLDECVTV